VRRIDIGRDVEAAPESGAASVGCKLAKIKSPVCGENGWGQAGVPVIGDVEELGQAHASKPVALRQVAAQPQDAGGA
jgi:hypothetical protein